MKYDKITFCGTRQISALAVVFIACFSALGFLSAHGQEQIGITVSHTPGSEWHPESEALSGVPGVPVIFVAGSIALVTGSAMAVVFLKKKTGAKALVKAVETQTPAEKKPLEKHPVQKPPLHKPPLTEKKPSELRTEPLRQNNTPVTSAKPPVEPVPPPRTAVVEPPISHPVPPPGMILQQPVSGGGSVPGKDASPVKEAAVVLPAKQSAERVEEDDLLFRHVELLKRLKNKENE